MKKKYDKHKKTKKVDKTIDADMTHGSKLLEREFERQERARKIVEESELREKKEKLSK